MKLTKQRKVYLGVLAVGLVALVIDRAFLGGGGVSPSSAEGAVIPPVKAPAGAMSPQQPNVSIADRLAAATEAANASELKDAFRPSDAWLAQLRPSADRPAVAPLDLAQSFSQRHRLMGVMLQTGGGKAIVDDRCMAVGEKMDGFTLVAVEKNSAVFTCGDSRAELKLPQAPPPAADD